MTNRRDERVEQIETVVVELWVDRADASAPAEAAADPARVVLSAEEAELLGRILKSYLGDLRMEIADTDNPAMRRDLHREEDAIRGLLARLPVA